MAEIKIYGTLVNDTNEAIVKSTQVAAVKQDGTAATQSAVNADLYAKYAAVGNAYRVKGSMDTFHEVQSLTDMKIGDVWNVRSEFSYDVASCPPGTNVVWTGSEWDPLGGIFDMGPIMTALPEKLEFDQSNGSTRLNIQNGYGWTLFGGTLPLASSSASGNMSSSDKSKLDGIAAGAQVNVLESVKVNGTALSVTGKSVNIDLSPYAKSADTIHVADVVATATDMNLKLRKAAGETPICNAVFHVATTSTAGLMSAADKQRLNESATIGDRNMLQGNIDALKGMIETLEAKVAALEAALTLK